MSSKVLTIAFALTVMTIAFMNANVAEALSVVTDGLVSYWSLDEETIKDHTVEDVFGENDGTIKGDPQIVKGKFGEALKFDGEDDCVAIGNVPALAGEKVTITAWVCWEGGTGDYDPIVTQSDANWAGYYFYIYVSEYPEHLAFWLDDTEALSSSTFPVDEWHFVAGTHDGTTLRVYIDGVLEGTEAKTGAGLSKTGYIGFDDYTPDPQYFKGIIDEVAIYDRVLSEDEIIQNMNAEGMAVVSGGKLLAETWGKIKYE